VDIVGVRVQADFEVIQTVEDADPYPALLGLDYAIDMGGIINLKKISMIFENNGIRVIVPLDPAEGERYTETVRRSEEVDHLYKIFVQDEDWINPTAGGVPSGDKENEYLSDSEGELEHWQRRLQDTSTL